MHRSGRCALCCTPTAPGQTRSPTAAGCSPCRCHRPSDRLCPRSSPSPTGSRGNRSSPAPPGLPGSSCSPASPARWPQPPDAPPPQGCPDSAAHSAAPRGRSASAGTWSGPCPAARPARCPRSPWPAGSPAGPHCLRSWSRTRRSARQRPQRRSRPPPWHSPARPRGTAGRVRCPCLRHSPHCWPRPCCPVPR